jgi:DNA repair exonuclease SbcCD ATPase subunit
MAQVLSLKELRSSSALKAEISKLEEEKAQLLDQLERQKLLEKKLRDDLVTQKKDFEHLEKQFDHFAGIEAEFEALQQQVQMERLEQLVDGDKKDAVLKNQVKKARDELKEAQDELRELKLLDPQRLKRQVTDLKKKSQEQATDNQNLNKALVAARKELKDVTTAKESLEAELKAARGATDCFWQSVDGTWALFETAAVLKDETVEDADKFKRIRCMNLLTGMSALSKGRTEDDKAEWLGTLDIPADVCVEAGKRLLSIAAELDDEPQE